MTMLSMRRIDGKVTRKKRALANRRDIVITRSSDLDGQAPMNIAVDLPVEGHVDHDCGMGGTPFFITVFEPLARVTLYLTDQNTLGNLSLGARS